MGYIYLLPPFFLLKLMNIDSSIERERNKDTSGSFDMRNSEVEMGIWEKRHGILYFKSFEFIIFYCIFSLSDEWIHIEVRANIEPFFWFFFIECKRYIVIGTLGNEKPYSLPIKMSLENHISSIFLYLEKIGIQSLWVFSYQQKISSRIRWENPPRYLRNARVTIIISFWSFQRVISWMPQPVVSRKNSESSHRTHPHQHIYP